MRTLLIGLDAACERVLKPLFEDDAVSVSTLETLFESGTNGPLRSQVPPWTASAWPSLYTGTNPGKHGVFGFLTFENYDYDVVDATCVRQPPLWELLDHRGLSSVVVNVPVTHPPKAFDGALIPGYTAPDRPTCHPSGLLEDVQRAIGDYHVYADNEGTAVSDRDHQLHELCDLARMRGAAFEYLADRVDPDFGFLQFQVSDTVCHQFPGDHEATARIYQSIDSSIGAVLERTDPDTVIVASDHGIGSYQRRVAPNVALRRGGLLTSERSGDGMPTWSSIRERDLRNGTGESRVRDAVAGLATLAARMGLTSQRIGKLVERLGATEFTLRHAPDALVRAGSEQVGFPDSTAYVRSRVECGVRLNVEGRESDGVVPPDQYDDVRRQVTDVLKRIETPAGKRVYETVGLREEFFHGPAVEDAVDVVAVPRDFNSYVTSWLTDPVVEPVEGPAWDHKRNGVVALAGSAVDEISTVDGAHLFDIAPTVLATLGLPTAQRMDGTVLPPVASTSSDRYPDRGERGPAVGAESEVTDRLADLGYLE